MSFSKPQGNFFLNLKVLDIILFSDRNGNGGLSDNQLLWINSHSPGMLKDIFDGSVYKELKPNLFPNQSIDDLDLAISLFIDRFAPFKGGSSKMTIVHIVFLSLPPNERLVFILFFFVLCILT